MWVAEARFQLSSLTILFNRQWWRSTLLVLAAMVVMVRLGFWQLARLEERRAFNAEVTARLEQAPLTLTGETVIDAERVAELKYRSAKVRGEYDHTQEIVLKNQNWRGHPGLHLITPLVIAGSDRAMLIDRGWIPYEAAAPENWGKYAEPGVVEVTGMVHLTQATPGAETSPPQDWQKAWFRVDIDRLQKQISYPLLPIYLQQAPGPGQVAERMPYRAEEQIVLSEGSHLSYAIQWFSFTLIAGVGYIHFVRKNTAKGSENDRRPLTADRRNNLP